MDSKAIPLDEDSSDSERFDQPKHHQTIASRVPLGDDIGKKDSQASDTNEGELTTPRQMITEICAGLDSSISTSVDNLFAKLTEVLENSERRIIEQFLEQTRRSSHVKKTQVDNVVSRLVEGTDYNSIQQTIPGTPSCSPAQVSNADTETAGHQAQHLHDTRASRADETLNEILDEATKAQISRNKKTSRRAKDENSQGLDHQQNFDFGSGMARTVSPVDIMPSSRGVAQQSKLKKGCSATSVLTLAYRGKQNSVVSSCWGYSSAEERRGVSGLSARTLAPDDNMPPRLSASLARVAGFSSLIPEAGGPKDTTRKSVAKMDNGTLFGSMSADSSHLDQVTYDVSVYYRDTGICQQIARSDLFNNLTLTVIAINAVYMGVDIDRNPANVGGGDPPLPFVICDFIFCSYFSFEWTVRFFSFDNKRDSLKDMWFRFDTALVALMIWETWAMPLLVHLRVFGKAGGSGPVGLIKMLRLLRLARMARLMRAFPELIAMIKGVRVAAKAVGSALAMLLLLIYTFAIVMFMQLRGNSISDLEGKFNTLGNSMWTMLCDGVFLENFGTISFALLDEDGYLDVAIFIMFVLAANLTVMNMLIGVLCEVVSVVAKAEKEDAAIKLMKETLLVLLKSLDEDESGMLSKSEISKVLEDADAQIVLSSLAVDVNSLVDQLDMVFSNEVEISIQNLMNFILMLRGERQVTVKDMTHGQGVTRWRIAEVKREVSLLHQKIDVLGEMLESFEG